MLQEHLANEDIDKIDITRTETGDLKLDIFSGTMADKGVSTPLVSTKRKKVASPLLDKDGQELDAEGKVIGKTSPIPIQDPKKLIIEASSENNCENGQAGNDPKGQGRSTTTNNMAPDMPNDDNRGETSVISEGKRASNRPTRERKQDPLFTQPLPKRGRPRKQALSMEPNDNIGKQDIYSLLLDIKQTNAFLGDELAKTIDNKMDEVKNELCTDMKDLKLNVDKNTGNIMSLERSHTQQQALAANLEQKIVDLEDELNVYGKRIEKNVLESNEHMQTVECALAGDIETVKVGTEVKFQDIEEKQKEGENRLMEISQRVEQENSKMKIELEDLKLALSKLQRETESLENKFSTPFFENTMPGEHSTSQSSFETASSSRSNAYGIFQDSGSSELDRTLIVNSIRESFRGDLKLVVKDFAREM